MTNDENIVGIVRGIAAGDKVAASDAFVNSMRERIGAALESKRIEVAQNMIPAGEFASEDIPTDSE